MQFQRRALSKVNKGKGKIRKCKPSIISLDSDDDDFELPPFKSLKHGKLMEEIASMKKDLGAIFAITKTMKVPTGLQRQLKDTFKCQICHATPISPPVIMARWCHMILGCEDCVNQWYGGSEGMQRNCPLCRAERSFTETLRS